MNLKTLHTRITLVVACLLISGCANPSDPAPDTSPGEDSYKADFDLSPDDLTTTGRNEFFILEPGFQIVLEGGAEKVTITVLDETETVGPYTTRVVEEREENSGALVEVSHNYFAISKTTGDVFYFGEAVDIYQNGQVVRHTGEWRADEPETKPGLIMPGTPVVGLKYYQEVAPGRALDRAEVLTLDEALDTPAGAFDNCLKTLETTPLEPNARDLKIYAPGIGMIQDARLLLTRHGFVELGG